MNNRPFVLAQSKRDAFVKSQSRLVDDDVQEAEPSSSSDEMLLTKLKRLSLRGFDSKRSSFVILESARSKKAITHGDIYNGCLDDDVYQNDKNEIDEVFGCNQAASSSNASKFHFNDSNVT